MNFYVVQPFFNKNYMSISIISTLFKEKRVKNSSKCYCIDTTAMRLQIKLIFYKAYFFWISDSMSDFILTMPIEFSIKIYKFHILKFFS